MGNKTKTDMMYRGIRESCIVVGFLKIIRKIIKNKTLARKFNSDDIGY